MPKPSAKTETARIVSAAQKIAAIKGWRSVTLDSVAKEAKLPLAKVKKFFAAPADIVPAIVTEITRESLPQDIDISGAPHDLLFDLIMARFDALQKHRESILAIAQEARLNPALGSLLARAVLKSIGAITSAVKTDLPRHAFMAGLAAVYTWTFWVWTHDKTRDMSKTMSALDRALRCADSLVSLLKKIPSCPESRPSQSARTGESPKKRKKSTVPRQRARASKP